MGIAGFWPSKEQVDLKRCPVHFLYQSVSFNLIVKMRYKFWIHSCAPNIKLIIFIDQYHTNLDKLSQLGWVISSESFYDESCLFGECGYCNAIISKYMYIRIFHDKKVWHISVRSSDRFKVMQNKINFIKNYPQWGLNSQPPDHQSHALPTVLARNLLEICEVSFLLFHAPLHMLDFVYFWNQ